MSTQSWQPGDLVGNRYRLERLVGQGGFAQVWQAYDTSRKRTVAVKALTLDPDADGEEQRRDRDRFREEAERTSSLVGGPGILPIHDWGEDRGRPYLVMRFADGDPLNRVMRGPGLTVPEAVHVVGQVAAALAYAHRYGVVHRDVKPSNVMVRRVGEEYQVWTIDFGIAAAVDRSGRSRRTKTGVVMGSWAYMAPERIPLEPADIVPPPDPAVDVYGLACLLYECLTGEPAFRVKADTEIREYFAFARAHRAEPRPRPSGTSPFLTPFDVAVSTGLAVDPAARFADAAGADKADRFAEEMTRALVVWKRLTGGPTTTVSPWPTRSSGIVRPAESEPEPEPEAVPESVPEAVPEPEPTPEPEPDGETVAASDADEKTVVTSVPDEKTVAASVPSVPSGPSDVSPMASAATGGAVTGLLASGGVFVAGATPVTAIVVIVVSWAAGAVGAGAGSWARSRRRRGSRAGGVS